MIKESRHHRIVKLPNEGAETNVYNAVRKRDKAVKLALKLYERFKSQKGGKADVRGFDAVIRQELLEHQAALKREYGPYIPIAHFLRSRDSADRFVLAQERLDLAEPADIFAYYPVDFEETETQAQLADLSQRLQKNFKALLEGDEQAVMLDITGPNIVLTKDDQVRYLDNTSVNAADWQKDLQEHAPEHNQKITDMVLARLAIIEMLAGVKVKQVEDNELYRDLFSRHAKLSGIADEDEFYRFLQRIGDTTESEESEDLGFKDE